MTDETPPLDVLVAGPAYCDVIFAELDALPAAGTERFAGRFLVTAGGSAITAVALARLGRRVGLVADVGQDTFGGVVRELLDAEGVDTRWLRSLPGSVTPVTAVLSTPAERSFATYLPDPSEPLPLAGALAGSGAGHLHIAGFPVARAFPHAVDIAHRSGATASFDPGWDASALGDATVRRVAREADVLLPSRLEAVLLVDGDEGMDASAALDALIRARNGGVTVVKDGATGAIGNDGGASVQVPSPPVDAVDPTGAGDVFDAGFLDAWLDGADLGEAMRRGAACGAHAVTVLGGAISAPTADQRDARLAAETRS